METKYPTLKRPKRKLCYLTNSDSPSKKWTGTLTLGDVDKLFDDLDSPSVDDVDLGPPSPLLQSSDNEANQSEKSVSPIPLEGKTHENPPECHRGPKRDILHTTTRSPSLNLEVDLDLQLKKYVPLKTSSPIEENMAAEHAAGQDNENHRNVSPILFACEDERKDEAKREPPSSQKPQGNGHVAKESDDFDLESPPNRIALSKPRTPSHKKEVERQCKESHTVRVNTPKNPNPVGLNNNKKTQRQEKADLPVSQVQQDPEPPAHNKKSENVQKAPIVEGSTRVGKDMTTFLQKLKEAGLSKPACSRKSQMPVKAPTPPPEPEDDFLILEDEPPLFIFIPTKNSTSKRQSRTSSTDKDSSTDKGTKESKQNELEMEQAKRKQVDQTANQKSKKKKRKEKKSEEPEPGNDVAELDPPAVNLMEQEEQNKKKPQLKRVPPKESDETEELQKDSRETGGENESLKIEKKAQKSSEIKTDQFLKIVKENAKTGKAKPTKGGRKARQEPKEVKETMCTEIIKERSQEPENLADPGLQSDRETEAQTEKDSTNGKDEQNQQPLLSDGTPPEADQVLGKRKRKQTGQWWMNNTEHTQTTDNQPTDKKQLKKNKERVAASRSPVKAKKEKVSKKKSQTETKPSFHQETNKVQEKKAKQSKRRNKGGETPDRKKTTDELLDKTETERVEELEQQAEIPDSNAAVSEESSSPLDLSHRHHSLSTGDQVFQRVYHHVSADKQPITPVPASPIGQRDQLREAESQKRRRKPPGNWWAADGKTQEVENISQPQQKAKAQKERKKQSKQSRPSKLGTPKNGNVAASSKPQEGASVPPLTVKPLSAPKTVKRSLATFKDIFTSAAETPVVLSCRGAGQKKTPIVTVTDRSAHEKSVEGILCVDAVESNSPPNQDPPLDSKYKSEENSITFRSGPRSLIELQEYEDDNLTLPSSSIHSPLSASDLCAPPLKPLILQPQDEANLTEWFKSLWSASVNKASEVTPDQFDWYFYQGRALGFMVDWNSGTICNGKILLGSYMKKPLWVDHNATAVFNLLTSSVSVTINGSESHFNPGQSFMVPCGQAYSIKNISAQPAVLYFTRILAESLD
ncbi:inner centromere protein [Cheilinus undulatus]|uniref:inner centromere protein n=1 Tax=Cheilinus undulatus TaxID=241271 RepID=UPI001BD22958|nr:inner centromere protein [Cheilinus undulatus]